MSPDPQHTSTTFETLGHFEVVTDTTTGQILGTRNVTPAPGRVCGFHGKLEVVLTEPTVLTRGHKTVTVKASRKAPLRVTTELQITCGRLLKPVAAENLPRPVGRGN